MVKSLENQYYAALCANIITVSFGAHCGWPSSNFPLLMSDNANPFDHKSMNKDEASWVKAMLCIGGLVGNFLFAILAVKYGKKFALLLTAIPGFLSWVLILVSSNVTHLLVSRFFGGLQGGGALLLVPIYVTEISEDGVRGKMGSLLILSMNIGILLAYILGNVLSYRNVPLAFVFLSMTFFINFMQLPETPQHLLRANKVKEAEIALSFYRNHRRISQQLSPQFRSEMEHLKASFSAYGRWGDKDSGALSCSDFSNRHTRKILMIGFTLMALNQLCGYFAIISYTDPIFKESGSSSSPNVSAMIVGFVQLLGSCFSTMLVDRSGRKFLIIMSTIGTGIGLFCIGSYNLFDEQGYDIKSFNWVPLVSLMFATCMAWMGVVTLPYLVMSEIMPPRIRIVGYMICLVVLWVIAFLLIKCLSVVMNSIGMYTPMYFFAICCFAGAVIVAVFVPETKEKSIEAIMEML